MKSFDADFFFLFNREIDNNVFKLHDMNIFRPKERKKETNKQIKNKKTRKERKREKEQKT